MKLYEMTGAFNEIFNMLNDDEVNLQALEDTLQALEGAMEQKAGGYVKIIKSLEAMANGYSAEAKRLSERAKVTENRIKWLKESLLNAMVATSKDKILTDVGTVRRQKSPAGVKVIDQNAIPRDFWHVPEPIAQLDKDSIKEALKQGKEIPGVILQQGYHIRIQ